MEALGGAERGRVRTLRWHNRLRLASMRPVKFTANIWSLPGELTLHLLKSLHIKDLLNLRSTHPHFRDLIDNHCSVWTSINFQDEWPTQPTIRHFVKAASYGNLEALVKLGIAYLYNEGLPGNFEGKKITANGEKAAEMFCQVELLTPHTVPFTWLFIRPPWATTGACCKECVYLNMKNFVNKVADPSVLICLAKTVELVEEDCEETVTSYLSQAASQGSAEAAFLLWHYQYHHNEAIEDCASELCSLRHLRDVAKLGGLEAQISLCKAYALGKYGGYTEDNAASFVRNFLQSSKHTYMQEIFRNQELTHSMRYILLDWLVEVASMKDFASHTLHVAISVVDRYLQFHKTTRSKLQLLGVAAMVLCSRFLGKDIITIREAAWLTDNTYKYEDVVRMMGEITATLRGEFRVVTTLDHTEIIGLAAGNDQKTQCLAEYLCEMALLQSTMCSYRQPEIAASCVLLARLHQRKENAWSHKLQQFTGFSLQQLLKCALHLHEKCFVERAMVDHRDVVLQAVKQRYSEEEYFGVSSLPMWSREELRYLLGGCDPMEDDSNLQSAIPCANNLITSPPKGVPYSKDNTGSSQMSADREQAATPTLEKKNQPSDVAMNESMMSGYEGDMEDEGESFVDMEGYDSDLDLESLWCADKLDTTTEPQSHDEDSFLDVEHVSYFDSMDTTEKKPLLPARLPQSHRPRTVSSKSRSSMRTSATASYTSRKFSPGASAVNARGTSGESCSMLISPPAGSLPQTRKDGVPVFVDPNHTPINSVDSVIESGLQYNANQASALRRVPLLPLTVKDQQSKPYRKTTKRKSSCSLGNENKTQVLSL